MKRTPLYNEHLKLKARMVEFGGWEMPIQYSGVIDEHRAVRTAAGIFDVSHMGQFEFKGKDALVCVQYLTTNDVSKLANDQAVYSLLCNEHGTLVDDIIVYRFNPEHIMFVVNAGNIEKDWAWVTSHKRGDVEITNRSDDFALIAPQGPKAAEALQKICDVELADIKTFHMAHATVAGVKGCLLARTGYTGEDGFEIFVSPSEAPKVWQALLTAGGPLGLKPIGLGARDTLRLEMRYSLYGHEITEETNALEAGLGWVVKFSKDCDFIGRSALEKIKAEGLKRKCVGFKMIDPGIPREGYKIYEWSDALQGAQNEAQAKGHVCSGTMSPSLDIAIGTGYVPLELSKVGSKIFIDIRGKLRQAEITGTPFYKKPVGESSSL